MKQSPSYFVCGEMMKNKFSFDSQKKCQQVENKNWLFIVLLLRTNVGRGTGKLRFLGSWGACEISSGNQHNAPSELEYNFSILFQTLQ